MKPCWIRKKNKNFPIITNIIFYYQTVGRVVLNQLIPSHTLVDNFRLYCKFSYSFGLELGNS